MELAKYKACICEGSAENAIMDILLDNDLLIFTREEMLEEEVIRCRDGKRFEEKYLRKGFLEKISVIRILDSRRENFKLSKAYEHKVDVINVITAPEIEMLIIFNEDIPITARSAVMLRCVQLGIHISELDLLTIGTVLDMYTELQRDDEPHDQLASQDDMDLF